MSHAPLSPSASGYWLRCSARPILTRDRPSPSGPAAARGTAIHKVAELRHQHKVIPIAIDGVPVTADMAAEADTYVAWMGTLPGVVFIEKPLKFSANIYGTADLVHIHEDILEVADLKTGRKVVEPDSAQLLTYGVMALDEFDPIAGPFHYVRLTVHQFGAARSHLVSVEEIEAHRVKLVEAEEKFIAGALEYDTSACEYCTAAHDCPAKLKDMADLLSEPPTLTNLAHALDLAYEVEAWAKGVKAYALDFARDGGSIAGYHLAQGRNSYSWDDAATQTIIASGEVAPLSPSQLKKENIDLYTRLSAHIIATQSEPSLAKD